jgi:hypothetical protein
MPLSSPQRIEWPVCGSEGGEMAVTVQMQFESVVTELYQDAFVGSSIENGTTIMQFDLRNLTFNVRWGRPRPSVGVKSPTTLIFMNSRPSTIR